MAYLYDCPGLPSRAAVRLTVPKTASCVRGLSDARGLRVLQAAARPALLSRRQPAGQKGCRHEGKLTKDTSASISHGVDPARGLLTSSEESPVRPVTVARMQMKAR